MVFPVRAHSKRFAAGTFDFPPDGRFGLSRPKALGFSRQTLDGSFSGGLKKGGPPGSRTGDFIMAWGRRAFSNQKK